MSNAATEIVARAEFWHPPTTRDDDELEAEVIALLTAAKQAFPALELDAVSRKKRKGLHVFVSGHPRLVTMMKVRLLYRGWKLVGRIQFATVAAVRPTVPRHHDPLVWASVMSPARNMAEPVAPNMSAMHVPTRMGYQRSANAANASQRRSAHTYQVGIPYDQHAAHMMGIAHANAGLPDIIPSPPRSVMESNAQYKARRRHTQAQRNYIRRRGALMSLYHATAEKQYRNQTRKARNDNSGW